MRNDIAVNCSFWRKSTTTHSFEDLNRVYIVLDTETYLAQNTTSNSQLMNYEQETAGLGL